MSKEQLKVNLNLLKKLLHELEGALNTSNSIREEQLSIDDYIVEMSKAQGLTIGIVKEASLIITDIQYLTNSLQQLADKGPPNDLLEKILGSVKGGGNSN